MAVLYVCRGCDEVIYVFSRVGQDSFGLPTPSELRGRVSSKCPKCGRELGAPGINDVIIVRRGELRKILKRASGLL
ncbi:MAG TPA: hypothetical protein VNL13_01870 [Sulfolobales archaeon]|nr:hypothetical protein [Sulfolobales archaeon]